MRSTPSGNISSLGHINPSFQFAKRLVKLGVSVTIITTSSALNRMTKSAATPPRGLAFLGFSDGYDDGNGGSFNLVNDANRYMKEIKIPGSEAVAKLITSAAETGQPFIHVVYTIILGRPSCICLSRAFHSPLDSTSHHLWYLLFTIYYYYINGYGDSNGQNKNDPSWSVEFPGLPPLTAGDLPSFLLASNTFNFALPLFEDHFAILDTETNAKVLVNTFDALEAGALRAIDREVKLGCPFGSISAIAKKQMEEIAHGLLECERLFLWVVRASEEEKLSCKEQLEKQAMIVPWCSQVEVLSHPSVGCFVTNGKLVEDVWKTRKSA
ncbi:crocetin glucosyltransferase, chloroplastic-like [Rhododendron vialii]|uniref:crocetin glucosyltransferase, chloroplastic-like n=1 Tax=Rhododendron vialii TaxID=182163 RepID=UPI00265FA2B3|nr:crocetin glucosyltransferase, chloroplastic-like [Rhododendron vialii]